MKYRLLKDLPYLEAGAIFNWDDDQCKFVAFANDGDKYKFMLREVESLKHWFEPLSPQEEVEELTEDDFFGGNLFSLTKQGRDKLIRKFSSIGKGAKDD